MKQEDGRGDDGKEWARAWTEKIGEIIKYVRNSSDPRVSAQELSDRCSELGYPIARNTITNLENGRKETISVQEVVIIAAAFDVAPSDLLYRLDEGNESIRWLPNQTDTPVVAARRFAAPSRLWRNYHRHDSILGQLRWTTERIEDTQAALSAIQADRPIPADIRHVAGDDPDVPALKSSLRTLLGRIGDLENRLQDIRVDIHESGRPLPPLGGQFMYIDGDPLLTELEIDTTGDQHLNQVDEIERGK